ncbi:MAG TPA: hypothetical protein VGI33_02075 [Paenibacillus sp.]|jgi:hypothetical protein
MKRLTYSLLVIVMLFTFSIPAYASSENNTEINNGVAMSIEQFDQLYGQSDSKVDAISNSEKNASISLSEILIKDDTLSFKAIVDYDSQQKEVIASGKLYNSTKKTMGINSVVADLEDENNNFNIHLFEVFYGNQKARNLSLNSAIVDSSFLESPHVNFYMTDSNNNVLLFEIAIPDELSNITVNNDEVTAAFKDYAWFINVLPKNEIQEIEATPEAIQEAGLDSVSPFAINNDSDWTDTILFYEEKIGGVLYKWRSLPMGTWYAQSVSNDTTWTNAFKVAESATADGVALTNMTNIYSYEDVNLVTTVGGKTKISRAYIAGVLQGKASGQSLAALIGAKLYSTALPGAPSLSDIKSWATAAKTAMVGKTVTLGSSNLIVNNAAAVSQAASSKNTAIYKNTTSSGGHSLTLQTVAQYNSSTATSVNTTGIMDITWKTKLGSSSHNTGSKHIEFSYTSSPK